MKWIFISDFFENEINGGAEMTDAKLRSFLGFSFEKQKSIQTNLPWLEKNKNARFIISNFVNLGESEKKFISLNCEYIIWEHDHKYLKSRNPSIFKDFLAPKDQLQNVDFYRNAKAVVCQTKLHADVVRKNLEIDNILNFGGSIWSNEELNYLEKEIDLQKRVGTGYRACFAKSDNPFKGSEEAEKWCKEQIKNGLEFVAIEPCKWEQFIFQLGKNSTFVFFPQVLETCSRVSVEARMLGLKVVGNKNISALHEDWFQQFKGKDLINFFREKNKLIPKFIEFAFQKREKVLAKEEDITVILNLYKRPQNLQKQIDAIRNQSVRPKEIWVWQNYANQKSVAQQIDQFLPCQGIDKWITSNHNWKFTGRFAMAQLAQTKFVAIFDDDTIPGKDWFKNCLETSKKTPGICGGIGIVLHDDSNYHDHHRHGWATQNKETEFVDLVGHAWFFPKEYLKFMWMEEPYSWDNGEDIHFAYCAQKYGNIKSLVPPQDTNDKSSSIMGYELGVDSVASSVVNPPEFYSQRNACVSHATQNGWKRVQK